MTNSQLSELTTSDYQEWDAFVRRSSSGSIFQMTGWIEAVCTSFGHRPRCLIARQEGRIVGILPLVEVKSFLFGHSLVSVPFGVYGGILADSVEASKLLRSRSEDLAQELGVDYLELRYLSSLESEEIDPATWHRKELYVTFRREMLPSVDENMQAIPRKQRAMIRKAEKGSLVSRIGLLEDLDAFYPIYATNVRDLGTPVFPKKFFRRLMECFPDAFILSVWKDGQMVAGVLTFIYGNTLLPYYGGGLREYFDLAINDFMYWRLMVYGCENGFEVFDFGRSKQDTGSYRFKKHWGFEPEPLDYRFFLVKKTEDAEHQPG